MAQFDRITTLLGDAREQFQIDERAISVIWLHNKVRIEVMNVIHLQRFLSGKQFSRYQRSLFTRSKKMDIATCAGIPSVVTGDGPISSRLKAIERAMQPKCFFVFRLM